MFKLTDGIIRFMVFFGWLHTVAFIILIISLNASGINPGGALDWFHLMKFWSPIEYAQHPETTPIYNWYPNVATTVTNGDAVFTWRGPSGSFTVPPFFVFPATDNVAPFALHIVAILLGTAAIIATPLSTFRADTRTRSHLNTLGLVLTTLAWLVSVAGCGLITAKMISRVKGLTANNAPVAIGFGGGAMALMWAAEILVPVGMGLHIAGLVYEKRARLLKTEAELEEAEKHLEEVEKQIVSDSSSEEVGHVHAGPRVV